MEALDEFTTRHRSIRDRITETYKIGNQMTDYLEKQIILDHHFRGEQDLFEQEYPHLQEKAEKLLGSDTYFDCSPLTGSPISEEEQPELYARLMQIQAKITQNLDENLAKHNVKIDQFEEDIAPSDSEFGITDIELSDIEELQEERGAQTTENENEEEEKLVDEAKILSQNTEEVENVTAAPSEPSGSEEAATEENDKKKA